MRRLRPWAIGAAVAVIVVLLASVFDPWDWLPNPFEQSTVDRSAPALLNRLEDLSEYRAASAQLQELVDIENDTRFIPSIISGDRVSFLAFGTVDAVVDFGTLGKGAVKVSDDRKTVEVTLPHARIDTVKVDPDKSRVLNRQRGVLDRLGSVFSDNPTSERELYKLSEKKLRTAAGQSKLTARAETNTRRMLQALFGSLGFEHVTITFATNPKT
ncbi:MAG: uncharacterized protein JWO68_3688 [Actinomycetia bacterium]|nr:uncharacterized protein [Actinomycetes bacterium]